MKFPCTHSTVFPPGTHNPFGSLEILYSHEVIPEDINTALHGSSPNPHTPAVPMPVERPMLLIL